MPVNKPKTSKKTRSTFTIDCTEPVNDSLLDMESFKTYVEQRFKVSKRGKSGSLGDEVTVTVDDSTLTIASKSAFAKRYVKYLTKKYLKTHSLRDYIRVIADSKKSYYLRYLVSNEEEEVADEE